MKYVSIRLPVPRERLCSITQTALVSSRQISMNRQISMKWLPPPSVPIWHSSLLVGPDALVLLLDRIQTLHQPGLRDAGLDAVRQLAVLAATAVAYRHAALDTETQLRQIVGQVVGAQRGAHCSHAAADIHADRRWNDGATGRNYRAHGCAFAQMHVWHHCDPRTDKRDRCDIARLRMRLLFQRHLAYPALDRGAAFGVQNFKVL